MKRLLLFTALLALLLTLSAYGGKDTTQTAQAPAAAAPEAPAQAPAATVATAKSNAKTVSAKAGVDLDLTKISGTVVYSQVYDMMNQPENYVGKTVKVRGNFSYFQDPETKQEYFATVIADAAACCAQGIEFVWAGNHSYPKDYPPIDAEITVTGTFDTYLENNFMYVQLVDADVSWDKGVA